jgi:APA family basic amino acid/polyamine antiporter
VSLGIIFLRSKRPDLIAPFRTPWVPVVPLLSAAVALFLMSSLPGITWLRLVIWMAIGMAIYFLYGRTHSELHKAEMAAGARR